MEFPELGSHCTVSSCNRLDFLPFECDACHKIFCKDHQTYEQHNCTEAYDKNTVVPTCPLCNQPVPIAKGEDPNVKVDNHIQQECRSEKAKKLYTNKCSFPGCRKKELVPVTCGTCRKNFCLKHRFETNHNCQRQQRTSHKPAKSTGAVRPKPLAAPSRQPQSTALTQIGADLNRERLQRQQQRQQSRSSQPSHHHSSMSEEEALRQAIAASLSDKPQSAAAPQPTRDHTHQQNCDEDEALARAIAASLNDEEPKPKNKPPSTQRQNSRSSDCCIS